MNTLPKLNTKNPYHKKDQRRISISAEPLGQEELESFEKVVYPKDPATKKMIAQNLAKNLLFRNLDKNQKEG